MMNCTALHALVQEVSPRIEYRPDCCQIDGIVCRNQTVVEINWNSKQLTGTLPKGLLLLSGLEAIDLSFNNLAGPVYDLFGLSRLKNLVLKGNKFTGIDTFGMNLEILDLSSNAISGLMPALSMPQLKVLNLSVNGFYGPVPESIGSLVKLKHLRFDNTLVGGSLPEAMAGLGLQECSGSLNVCSDFESICNVPQCTTSVMSVGVIIGIVFSTVTVIAAAFLLWKIRTKKNEIGRGPHGIVFKESRDNKYVAVKKLYKPTVVQYALLNVNHPNLVQIFQMDTKQIVMELMHESLRDSISKRPMVDVDGQLTIAGDVASAMAYLARKHIIHRDLKTSNILLDAQCRAKVTDFGLSIVRETSMTVAESQAAGTVHYMAPECFGLSPKYSEKSDMFAYSVVLWELFTWQQPYKNVTPEEIQNSILNGERMDVPSSVPDAIRDLIQLGWHQDYKERPQFEELVFVLNPVDTPDTVSEVSHESYHMVQPLNDHQLWQN
ncbi:kinase-like domain-containing protein [Gorgonomyces haynaldii]|nr:kinase-like domain-containing protein [Gorgonomyces haynaldii]